MAQRRRIISKQSASPSCTRRYIEGVADTLELSFDEDGQVVLSFVTPVENLDEGNELCMMVESLLTVADHRCSGLGSRQATQIYLLDKNEEGERTWFLLADILSHMLDTR
jgi:hypothetical protein